MGRLDGQVAIVTGAAQGIGAAYARAMAAEGATVIVADILAPEAIVAEITGAGGRAEGMVTDVSDAASVERLVSRTVAGHGRIDILVNNAALFASLSHSKFEDLRPDDWDAVLGVNVRGVWLMSKAVVAEMRKRRAGRIVNIASTTALKGTPMMLHYASSKGAVIAMTRAMAREVGEDNIAVNAVAPGLTLSEGVEDNADWSDDWIGRNVASRAFKRKAYPDDLVGAVLFLASPDAAFITGQTLVVDGGAMMH